MDPSPATAARSRRRMPIRWALRAAASAIVLVVLFNLVPLGAVLETTRRLPPWLWVFALIAFLAGHLAAAAKWRLLIGPGVSLHAAFRAHLAGLAANLCLPGVAGGDVIRASLVFGAARDRTQLALGSVADRVLDTVGLAGIALIAGLVALGGRDGAGAERLLVIFTLVCGAGLLAVLIGLIAARVAARASPRAARLLSKLAAVADSLRRRPGRLAFCLALSLAVQTSFIAINLALAHAADVHVPVMAWAFAWAGAKIIAIAPISLGGLGVREASMAGLLAPFGADPAEVIAVALVWQTILYASGAIGAVAQLFWKAERNPAALAAQTGPSR